MTDYKNLTEQVRGFLEAEPYFAAALSNISALLKESLPGLNWAGFYLLRSGRLELGPFQGKAACTVIEKGRGVCGTAVSEDRTQLVRDVHEFPGHIACDSASNSEIVVPLHTDGGIYGVLDIDSPLIGRFTEEDRAGLEQLARILEGYIKNIMVEEVRIWNGK